MNLLKSLFVSFYVMLAAVFCLKSGSEISLASLDFGWLGSFVSSVSVLVFFGWLFTGKPARTGVNLWGFTILIFIGLLATLLAGALQGRTYSPFFISLFISAGWIGYLYWYSFFTGRPQLKLQLGKPLPAFTGINEKGQPVSNRDLTGSPTLLLFYRGNWCPLCMAQIREIAQQYREITSRRTKIYLVSPQSPRHTKSLARRFKVPFHYIVDENMAIARMFNLYHSNGTPFGIQVFGFDSDTIYPLVIITDADNKVAYFDQTDNYRLRPEPSVFIKVLQDL